MADNVAIAKTLFDAWEKRDFDIFAAQLAGEVSFKDAPRGQVVKGQANLRDWYASWATAFPDAVAGATVVAEQLTLMIQLGHIDAPTAP